MSVPTECHVVIAAAGNGTRFQSELPKQFHTIHGKPIILHTVEKFIKESFVKNIVVVAPEHQELIKKMETIFHEYTKNIVLTTGQASRHRSIFQGLKCLKNILQCSGKTELECESEIVVIHDGVRPFVIADDIIRVVESAKKYKEAPSLHMAAGIVKPLVSTVLKLDSEDMLEHSLDRTVHWSSEMPQAFHLGLILNAYFKCSDYELEHGTECLHVACKYGGVHAKLLQGDPKRLWKITNESDINPARSLLKDDTNTLVVCPDVQIEHIIATTKACESVQICTIKDIQKHSIERYTNIICSMQDQNHVFSLIKTMLDLQSNQKRSISDQMIAVFLLDQKSLDSNEEHFRKDFGEVAKQMKSKGVVSHICITKDLFCDNFNDLLLLISSFDLKKLPSGQILYL